MGNKKSTLVTSGLWLGAAVGSPDYLTIIPILDPLVDIPLEEQLMQSTSPQIRQIGQGLITGDLYVTPVGLGINKSVQVRVVEPEGHSKALGYLKTSEYPQASVQAEKDAYDMFTILGFKMPVTVVDGRRVFKTVVSGHIDRTHGRGLTPSALHDMQLMLIADLAFWNWDRNPGNYLVSNDEQHIIPLDNDSLTFGDNDEDYFRFAPESLKMISSPLYDDTPILPSVKQAWQRLVTDDPRWEQRALYMADILSSVHTIEDVYKAYIFQKREIPISELPKAHQDLIRKMQRKIVEEGGEGDVF